MFIIVNPENGELYRKVVSNDTVQRYAHIEQASRPIRIMHVENIAFISDQLAQSMLRSLTGYSFAKWSSDRSKRYLSFLIEKIPTSTFIPGQAMMAAVSNSDEDYIIESSDGKTGDLKPGTLPAIKFPHDPKYIEELDKSGYKIPVCIVPEIKLDVFVPTENPVRAPREPGTPSRPSKGVTLEIWTWLDNNPGADRAALKSHGLQVGWNPSTISVQYSAWKAAQQKVI